MLNFYKNDSNVRFVLFTKTSTAFESFSNFHVMFYESFETRKIL